ncbi:MAG: NAD(P)-dependent glycerol-1-phosphate dehydrogenase [Thermoplasmata archaeon]|mgnify:CR=1 FL=1|nr:MAG: NAD(P)-dependent glycerol-1-phosphate dehydrogenase [Thermoplasmata archaeon]
MVEFTKHKSMELPRRVVVGHDALESVLDVVENVHLSGPYLIVADNTTKKVAGDKIADMLEDTGNDVDFVLIKEADMETVESVVARIREIKAHTVFGVGGGRPIDVAKCSSHRENVPFVSVPTAASHDGIASSIASIRIEGRNTSIETRSPTAVIADTKIIASAPYRLMASGCGDIIANYTAVKDWRLARMLRGESYSSYAAALSEMTATMLVENSEAIKPGLEEAAWIVVKALVSSSVAMSIAGSSRPASGAEHKFSHALDIIAPGKALHGEQCGVGTIMMMHLHGGDWRMIRQTLKNVGAPTNYKELGVSREDIIKALTMAHKIRPERYTILGDRGLTEDAAERLAEETMVI